MENKLIATTFMAVGIVCILVLVAGCDEQSKADVKRCRLIADENIQLKKETELLKKDLEQRDNEIKEQKGQLDSCLQEKMRLEEKTENIIQRDMNDIFSSVLEENVQLREENEKLKARIGEPNRHPENKPLQ